MIIMAHIVERTKLTPGTADYQAVSDLFCSHNFNRDTRLEIQSIEAVQNYGLEQQFKEKQENYKKTYGHVRVVKLWHGTKTNNVAQILKHNFEVSRHGQNVGHRFGAGVSFSASAMYASHYSDKISVSGCMLLCDVLVSNILQVEENRGQHAVMQQPPYMPGRFPLRYDTTAKNKDTLDVVVKFEPNSYRPTHVVYFKRTAAPVREDDFDYCDYDDDDYHYYGDGDDDY
ncbi:hypothetical protein FOCC_FOCC016646 [Frankliniella occidentalis]|nr:hypothetical protein FOCC_FOCC016646 [Frankliniella occidentalis]